MGKQPAKKRFTEEELAYMRANGCIERPRGVAAKRKCERTRSVVVTDGDYQVFAKVASLSGVSVSDVMHRIALDVMEKNRKAFT